MSTIVSYDEVAVGDALPALRERLRRITLVMYAGVSGDYNPVHWNPRVATGAGHPDVVAHGMLTLATASRIVTAWAGDPGAVVSLRARFAKPVVVPDDDAGALMRITGRVAEKLPEHRVRVELTAEQLHDGRGSEVLKYATAVVRLS